ncbi:eukaryotic translation initiation factor 1A-like [Histomonas meleagridis]|uniref:eukaryotic translation initiation factor 1A-like n=1 Tax=Histomonas meleagridis TaxID=135588 RepID=UPI00355A86DA|nr:eukaryotic translation initiation factor 1A-like [Histomonas meleagridis]KAH0806142.1 eukaryotic translation initiation factor 1A-like [Histomonas meleagridis]
MGKTKKHASVTQKKKNNERLKNNELILAEDEMQTYAMVIKALGDRRFQCICKDGKERQCKIRGKFRGRLFITLHDILLISLREDDSDKADIIQKYRPDEIHELKKLGEFTDRDFNNEEDDGGATGADDDGMIVWTTEDIDKI